MAKWTYGVAPAGALMLGLVLAVGMPAAHGDPAGNNGTIKVDGAPNTAGPRNEPHVGCDFRLKFMHFDGDQTADIAIDGHAPSGSGNVSTRTGVDVGSDGATLDYTAADLDLTGLTPHPKQGYHLKITLTTDTPGGVKHKVFWYGCFTESPSPSVLPTTESASPSESASESVSPSVLPTSESQSPTESGSPSASVLGVKLTKGAKPPAVLGNTLTRPTGLPTTGAIVATLVAAAGAAFAIGAVLMTGARRRAKHVA